MGSLSQKGTTAHTANCVSHPPRNDPHTHWCLHVRSMPHSRMRDKLEQRRICMENARIVKWRTMLDRWDDLVRQKPACLKRRIHRGIPQVFRGYVWQR